MTRNDTECRGGWNTLFGYVIAVLLVTFIFLMTSMMNAHAAPSGVDSQGDLRADCTGKVTAMMDNAAGKKAQTFYLTHTVLGPAPQGGTSATVGPASQGRAFMVDPGESKTMYRHGSPGEIFELSFKGNKSKLIVPAKCKTVPMAISSGSDGTEAIANGEAGSSDYQSLGLTLSLAALVSCIALVGWHTRSNFGAHQVTRR